MGSRMSRLWVLFALIAIAVFLRSTAAASRGKASMGFIKSSCKVTRYPDLCVASLLAYRGSLPPMKSELVKVAVNVSLLTATKNSAWAHSVSKMKRPTKRERAALRDCIENFSDTSDQIKSSLAELKHLKRDTFKFQMSNVQTWLSAALTNEDSCLDGFQKLKGSLQAVVSRRVQKSSEMISNALALVNNLAAGRGY